MPKTFRTKCLTPLRIIFFADSQETNLDHWLFIVHMGQTTDQHSMSEQCFNDLSMWPPVWTCISIGLFKGPPDQPWRPSLSMISEKIYVSFIPLLTRRPSSLRDTHFDFLRVLSHLLIPPKREKTNRWDYVKTHRHCAAFPRWATKEFDHKYTDTQRARDTSQNHLINIPDKAKPYSTQLIFLLFRKINTCHCPPRRPKRLFTLTRFANKALHQGWQAPKLSASATARLKKKKILFQ